MKKILVSLLIILFAFVFSTFIFAQEIKEAKNTLSVEWGSNYYGNTTAVNFIRKIRKHFSIGLSLSFGKFNCTIPPGGTKLNVTNNLSNDLKNKIDIHYVINPTIYWHRRENYKLILLNTFGIGAGSYSVTFTQKTSKDGVYGEYEGSKKYARTILFFVANVVEYRSKKINNISFTLGVKTNLSRIKMPQTLTLTNNLRTMAVTFNGSGYYLVPYIEGFIRLGFSF